MLRSLFGSHKESDSSDSHGQDFELATALLSPRHQIFIFGMLLHLSSSTRYGVQDRVGPFLDSKQSDSLFVRLPVITDPVQLDFLDELAKVASLTPNLANLTLVLSFLIL